LDCWPALKNSKIEIEALMVAPQELYLEKITSFTLKKKP